MKKKKGDDSIGGAKCNHYGIKIWLRQEGTDNNSRDYSHRTADANDVT